LSAYLDASVVVSLFVDDSHTPLAEAWLAGLDEPPVMSRWTALEFSAALATRARAGALAAADRRAVEQEFSGWAAGLANLVVTDADLIAARDMIRFDEAALKGGDALHLAICRRAGLPIKTFDRALGRTAETMGVAVA
jgi:hypothetical protein